MTTMKDSFGTSRTLALDGGRKVRYFSLPALAAQGHDVSRLPVSLRILLENLLRNEDGRKVHRADIEALLAWDPAAEPSAEIAYSPARVVMQDFTGVPAIVDLAAMRDAIDELGGDPADINPLVPVDLIIDHSVQVDFFRRADALQLNTAREYERNQERYLFMRWGQQAFHDFRVVPPSTGIVHQINLEHLGEVVCERELDGELHAFPDTLVGTDSHTPMINGLGVVGWGVGGIEAEAAMLGQPVSLLVPRVVGVKLSGALQPGVTATDLVLTLTHELRELGVVGAFVEFFGAGLASMSLADRATISNMSPEFGCTISLFPVDEVTLDYLRLTAREERVALVEAYLRAQGLFRTADTPDPEFSTVFELDLATVVPAIAGPRRPQDRVVLTESRAAFEAELERELGDGGDRAASATVREESGDSYELKHGSVVIAAITSCTNTSNPSVMIAAGLLAKKAVERGLETKPWVKTSLAPGSQVVTEYLRKSGLLPHLEALGFDVVGYGCTTCIGNSGPLPEPVVTAIDEGGLVACSVLSGNRNFEGRISPDVRFNYLASPPLVVAYALAGRMDIDLQREPLGHDEEDRPVKLADLWPSAAEIREAVASSIDSAMFADKYASVFTGDESWRALGAPTGKRYDWTIPSTYIQKPTFFEGMTASTPAAAADVAGARIIGLFGDTITTDHISPAGAIPEDSPAGQYLISLGVEPRDFNAYGTRRGNHEVMVRGTFANVRLRNELVPGVEGGLTRHFPTGQRLSIYDAAMKYRREGVPLVVVAGAEYGTGSSRDWAAKGTYLLGIRAVIAESYERIHRSNLVGMGVLPLQFESGTTRKTLGLTGREMIDIAGMGSVSPGVTLRAKATFPDGSVKEFGVLARVDTPNEADYFLHGGILQFVLRSLMK